MSEQAQLEVPFNENIRTLEELKEKFYDTTPQYLLEDNTIQKYLDTRNANLEFIKQNPHTAPQFYNWEKFWWEQLINKAKESNSWFSFGK